MTAWDAIALARFLVAASRMAVGRYAGRLRRVRGAARWVALDDAFFIFARMCGAVRSQRIAPGL